MTGEAIPSLITGIVLSAANGFRVFVPMHVLSIGGYHGRALSLPPGSEWFQSLTGHLPPAPGFKWIGTTVSVETFAIATLCEIIAYYISWFDHLPDHVTTPAAVRAGVDVMASSVTGLSPFLQWILGIIAGGGAAGLIQGTTVIARGGSPAGSPGGTPRAMCRAPRRAGRGA